MTLLDSYLSVSNSASNVTSVYFFDSYCTSAGALQLDAGEAFAKLLQLTTAFSSAGLPQLDTGGVIAKLLELTTSTSPTGLQQSNTAGTSAGLPQVDSAKTSTRLP